MMPREGNAERVCRSCAHAKVVEKAKGGEQKTYVFFHRYEPRPPMGPSLADWFRPQWPNVWPDEWCSEFNRYRP